MNMNDRFGRTLVLLAIVSATRSGTVGATDSAASCSDVHFTSANPDKATEAKRLADQAAELAKRAGRARGRKPGREGRCVDSQADQRRDRVFHLERRWRGRSADLRHRSTTGCGSGANHRLAEPPRQRATRPSASRIPGAGANRPLAAQAMKNKNEAAPGSELKISDLATAAHSIAQKTAAVASAAVPKETPTAKTDTAAKEGKTAAANTAAAPAQRRQR